MPELTIEEKAKRYDANVEGAKKGGMIGGRKPKHFTPESKERQREGASRGGKIGGPQIKHFTPESKARQIEGARLGGRHSHGGHRKQS